MIDNNQLTHRGIILIVSAPPGAGKTSITRHLCDSDPSISLSISVTTRPQRPGEIDGIHYHFVEESTFNHMIENQLLLEYAHVFGYQYGTQRHLVEQALNQGHDVIFDIDWQGKQNLTQKLTDDLVSVFILPTSLDQLAQRMHHRGRDTQQEIDRRMIIACDEIKHWKEYDYVLINHTFTHSVDALKAILIAERLKRKRQTNLPEVIDDILKGKVQR